MTSPDKAASLVLRLTRGVASFAGAMQEHGIHVGLGTPPRCVVDGESWPCRHERTTPENTDLPVLIDWRATNRNAQTNTPPMRGEVFDDGRVETWLTPDNTEIPLQCAPPWTLAPANTDSPGSP